jgi:hypothetical protein
VRIAPAALAAALLGGCGQPVPSDKARYVGEWRANKPAMYLLINQDGSIKYKRSEGRTSTFIEAPIRSFEGDDFHVGVGPFTTRFVVGTAPYQDKEGWKMVVDDVELLRR